MTANLLLGWLEGSIGLVAAVTKGPGDSEASVDAASSDKASSSFDSLFLFFMLRKNSYEMQDLLQAAARAYAGLVIAADLLDGIAVVVGNNQATVTKIAHDDAPGLLRVFIVFD